MRYIYGHAIVICADKPDELRQIRAEIRLALTPFVKGATDAEKRAGGNKLVVQYLRDRCLDEPLGAQSECPYLFKSIAIECMGTEQSEPAQWAAEKDACAIATGAVGELMKRAAAAAAIPSEAPAK